VGDKVITGVTCSKQVTLQAWKHLGGLFCVQLSVSVCHSDCLWTVAVVSWQVVQGGALTHPEFLAVQNLLKNTFLVQRFLSKNA